MSLQDRHGWRNGICFRRRFRPVHGKRMFSLFPTSIHFSTLLLHAFCHCLLFTHTNTHFISLETIPSSPHRDEHQLTNLLIQQMSYDTPLTPQGQAMANLSTREQIRRGFKDMGVRSWSSAKNFGLIGAVFSGTECCIEGVSSVHPLLSLLLSS